MKTKLQARLDAARTNAREAYARNGGNVNAAEYVAAMAKVKALCEQIAAATPKSSYTSIEGDVWSV